MSGRGAPHIYLDVDDVLAETTRALAELARTGFGKQVEFDAMVQFDLRVSLDLDPDEHVEFMAAAHEDDFLLGLVPMAGAVEIVGGWYGAGAQISVVTGRPPHSRDSTGRWLERTGVRHHRLEHVDKYGRYDTPEAVKKEALADRDYAIVIEDSLEMAEFFVHRSDARVLLVDRPWNRASSFQSSRIQRVHDWSGIAAVCADLDVRLARSVA